MTDHQTTDRLRPHVCYAVRDVQDITGISMQTLIEAARAGDIARHLGEGFEMHLLGIDVVDWLRRRPASVHPQPTAGDQADRFDIMR